MTKNLEWKLSETSKFSYSYPRNYFGYIKSTLTKFQKFVFYSVSVFGLGNSPAGIAIGDISGGNESNTPKQSYFLDDEKEVLKKYAFWSDSNCDKPDEQSICMGCRDCKSCKCCRGCRSCNSCGGGPPAYGVPFDE